MDAGQRPPLDRPGPDARGGPAREEGAREEDLPGEGAREENIPGVGAPGGLACGRVTGSPNPPPLDPTAPDPRAQRIAELLHEAAELHHRVYRITDGTDADWASWYAQWL